MHIHTDIFHINWPHITHCFIVFLFSPTSQFIRDMYLFPKQFLNFSEYQSPESLVKTEY